MSDTKRLFIGVPLPEDFTDELEDFRNENSFVKGIRWVPKNNLHITLCFIGDYKIDRIKTLESEIDNISTNFKPFTLDFKELCFGPNFKKAYMIWAKFHSNESFL